jgi:hypothetical protein
MEAREQHVAPIDTLFDQFARAYERGDRVDVHALLAQVEGAERDALADRIERYIASAGRRPFDEQAFQASPLRARIERALRRS